MARYIFYLLLVIVYITSACKEDMPSPTNPKDVAAKSPNELQLLPPATNQQFTFLTLGDSYTIGESVPESDRWGSLLVGLLRAKSIDVANPEIIARTGLTTKELSNAIQGRNLKQAFHMVSLLIGVNDQYRGLSPEMYRTQFREVLQTAIIYANKVPGNVIVLAIPDWGVTPYAKNQDRSSITAEINAFNDVAKREAEGAGCTFIDINPLSAKAINDVSYVATDQLHFSGKMHLEWANLVLPAAERILK